MKKSTLFTVTCFLILTMHFNLQGQDSTMFRKHEPKERIIDNMFFGGNMGLQFGKVTFFELSPLVGYNFTEKIAAGVGITYQYYRYKDKTYEMETNVYGARVFGRYFFTDNLFGHVEYEHLNLEAFDFYPSRRVDVGSFLAGGGYFQRFNRNSGLVVMLLYNFTESVYTPYQNPIIRVGVNVGF
jgi:hypothetical protein